MSAKRRSRASRVARYAARALRGWGRLPAAEKTETAYLAVLALVAEVAVRVFPLPSLTRRLGIALQEGPAEGSMSDGPDACLPSRLVPRADAVDRLYRAWPRRGACLRRALVLGWRIRSARPTLRLGVARDGDAVRAHAWIEVGGVVVGDETGEFAPLRRASDASA